MVPSLIAACALSLVLSGAAVLWCVLFSNPAVFRRDVERYASRLADCVGSCEDMRAAWLKYRIEMEGLEEAINGVLDSVERKRRQTAGAASRLAVPNAEPEPVTRDEIVAEARKRVYGVG